jgi:uncharacterized membrane protein (DUF441 family)
MDGSDSQKRMLVRVAVLLVVVGVIHYFKLIQSESLEMTIVLVGLGVIASIEIFGHIDSLHETIDGLKSRVEALESGLELTKR